MGSAMISPTRIRGLSELYGSWKTTCTLRRWSRSAVPVSSARLRPSNSMAPAVGASAASTSFEVVVLPHPDSPTRPSVSPALIVKLIPSTALTTPRPLPSSEPPTGKCFLRSRTSSSGLPTCRRLLDRQPAPDARVVAHVMLPRLLVLAAFQRLTAARMEATPGWQIGEIRRLAGDAVERLLDAELWNRVEQGARVRMPGAVEQTPHRLHLHDLAGVHHRDLVAHLGNDPEVVRDEDQRDAARALELLQEVQVLNLDGDVEVGGGLVGDDDPGPSGLGDRADDALAHAAAHLVREGLHAALRRRNAHRGQELLHALPQRLPAERLMIVGRLRHLLPDREQRIERRHRVLEDGRDPPPADPTHLRLALFHEIVAVELDAAAHNAGAGCEQAHDGVARRGLPAAGLAHEAERLAGLEREADAVHRLHDARAAEADVVRPEVADPQERRHLPLDLPDLPGPRERSVDRVPVAVHRIAFRKHLGSHGVHKRVQVERHQVAFLDEDALDLLRQPLPFRRIDARLVLGPQGLDLRLTDVGGLPAADRVEPNQSFGASGPRIDPLDDGPIAREALAALARLRHVGRRVQHLHFGPHSGGAQIVEDTLGHVEVRSEGNIPVELEAVGEAGLRQQLFRLGQVVRRHRQFGPIPTQRVAVFVADPVAPGLADSLGLLLHEERSVDREADGLAHALVVEGARRLVVAWEHQMPGCGEVGVPAQLGIRHHPLQQLAGHAVGEIKLAGLQAGHAGRQVPDAPDVDRLDARSPAAVLVPRLERGLHARFLTHELERPRAHRARLEAVLAHPLVVVARDAPPDATAGAVVEIEEIHEQLPEMEDDGAGGDDLDAVEVVLAELEDVPAVVLVGPLDVRRGEGVAVLEFEARPQAEGRLGGVRAHLGGPGQAG